MLLSITISGSELADMLRERIKQILADSVVPPRDSLPGTTPIKRPPPMPDFLNIDPAILEERRKQYRTHMERKAMWLDNLANIVSRGEQSFTLSVDDLFKLDLLVNDPFGMPAAGAML